MELEHSLSPLSKEEKQELEGKQGHTSQLMKRDFWPEAIAQTTKAHIAQPRTEELKGLTLATTY